MQGRRKKLFISEILDKNGVSLNTPNEIREAAVEYFADQLKNDSSNQDFSMLDYIPKLITAENNDRIVGIPNRDEVKM